MRLLIVQPLKEVVTTHAGMKLSMLFFLLISFSFSSPTVDAKRLCRKRNRPNKDRCQDYRTRLDTAFEALRIVSKCPFYRPCSRSGE